MAAITGGNKVVLELCEALGLDPAHTHSIDISIRANDVVVAVTELYITEDQMRKMSEIVKRYELIEITQKDEKPIYTSTSKPMKGI